MEKQLREAAASRLPPQACEAGTAGGIKAAIRLGGTTRRGRCRRCALSATRVECREKKRQNAVIRCQDAQDAKIDRARTGRRHDQREAIISSRATQCSKKKSMHTMSTVVPISSGSHSCAQKQVATAKERLERCAGDVHMGSELEVKMSRRPPQ